jgi:hypothetical protein
MEALSSLNKLYSLPYALILIGLLFLLAAIGLFIYVQVTRCHRSFKRQLLDDFQTRHPTPSFEQPNMRAMKSSSR